MQKPPSNDSTNAFLKHISSKYHVNYVHNDPDVLISEEALVVAQDTENLIIYSNE